MSPQAGASRHVPPGTGLWRERIGRVVTVEEGLLLVRFRAGTTRVTHGGAMLARMAADRDNAPRAGDRVLVRRWADGRATAERVIARPVP